MGGAEKAVDLVRGLVQDLFEVHIFYNNLVSSGAGAGGERDEGSVRKVVAPPEIVGSSVTMFGNEHVAVHFGPTKGAVVVGRVNEGRADSEKGEVEGPHVLEGRLDGENSVGAHQRLISVGSTVERHNGRRDRAFDGSPKLGRQDKEKAMIREQGDDKDVDEENAGGEGERAKEGATATELVQGLGHRGFPNVVQGNRSANRDAQMDTRLAEGETRPGGGPEVLPDACPPSGGGAVETTKDLSRLIPRLETREKVSMMLRAG